MKIESIFLLGIGLFFGCVGLAYWFLAYEDTGTMMLFGTFTLGMLTGGYYFFWHRRFHGHKWFFWGHLDRVVGDRPEDRSDATIEEGAGVISTFPSTSIWPFVLGMGAFVMILAAVFGIWLVFPGLVLFVSALCGVTAESRRGGRH
jgi:hypothetical protein